MSNKYKSPLCQQTLRRVQFFFLFAFRFCEIKYSFRLVFLPLHASTGSISTKVAETIRFISDKLIPVKLWRRTARNVKTKNVFHRRSFLCCHLILPLWNSFCHFQHLSCGDGWTLHYDIVCLTNMTIN